MRLRLKNPLRGIRQRRTSDIDGTPTVTDALPSPSEEPPEIVPLTFEENIEKLFLHEASKLLIERENRLFGEISEEETFTNRQEEIAKLHEDYRTLYENVRHILLCSMYVGTDEVSVETLSSTVKVICQEEEQYQAWKEGSRTPPRWRRFSWKWLHDELLLDLVIGRLEVHPTTPPDTAELLHREVNHTAKQLKEDLLCVVKMVKLCYPPHMDICNFYTRTYHKVFSRMLRGISELILVDKDYEFLLRWVNEFYPGILQEPELVAEIDTKALGKLLLQENLEPLEKQYLSNQQSLLTTYVERVLATAEQHWNEAEEPQREDGCYVSPVAYDIIQIINGMVTSTATVVGDLQKAQSITCKLSSSMERFKNLQSNIIRRNKANSPAYIKANLGCIQQFRDVFNKNSDLFTNDEQEKCLRIVDEMKQSAHAYLLSPVHNSLKSHYRKLGTNDWLKKSVFENLLENIETNIQDLHGLTRSCHQELISQFHQEVVVKYVNRLLKGEVKLKNQELQEQAYKVVKDNAETLHHFFSIKGSTDEWLKDVLTKIAEVLKLQDLPAIQMQVASLGICFPDISERHVSALLKLKTNVSTADRRIVKETLVDILNETHAGDAPTFFSQVEV